MKGNREMARTAPGELRKRVVLVPYSFQGHITPMLQLGSILDSHGFSITVVHTKFNSPNPSDHPSFTFVPLQDGLDGYDTSFYNILNFMAVMNANCEAPFEEQMTRMLKEDDHDGGVACVVYDTIMKFVDVVAAKLKIPSIVLRTNSAAYMHSHMVLFQLLEEKKIPLPAETELHVPIPEVRVLRFKDLPLPANLVIPEPVLNFLHSYTGIKSCSAVIWNTVELLDSWPLQQLQQHWQVPFFPIGPLHMIAQQSHTSLLEEDSSCLSWLDKQSRDSVLFISLGSLAIIDEEELIEMAWGIANSEQRFLWVLRPSLLLSGSDPIKSLPQDFKEITRDRGCIVKWAPQKKVLGHQAVGGFLTHCGWNSTLEGISEGVPVICRPSFGDQPVNARYLTHVWKAGVEVEDKTRGGYEGAVRTLMGSGEGEVMRQMVAKLKQEVECSIKGGASHESLGCLVEFIASLTAPRI